MSTKALLKTARDKLNKKDFSGARDAAERVLDFEPSNYTAHVFLALSAFELNDYDKSEKVYKAAIELEPTQLLARQGLLKFYEKTNKTDNVIECLRDLSDFYVRSGDASKLAETMQRYIELRREHGTKLQIIQALMEVLPGSDYYTVLSSLPEPDPTNPSATTISWMQSAIHDSLPILEEVVSLLESEEQAKFTKEFNARRTRLGAPNPNAIRKDLDREICGDSKLPSLYNEVLNHPKTSEELRVSTEAKLIEQKQRHLFSVSSADADVKKGLQDELVALVDGVVLIRRPNQDVWNLCIEWQDYENFEELDQSLLKNYLDLFPASPLSSIIKGYLLYHGVSLSDANDKKENEEDLGELGLDILLSIPVESINGVFTSRAVSEVYADVEDYENAAKLSREGLKHLSVLESNVGKKLTKTRVGLQVILATSLVHLHPPKNHDQAIHLITEILAASPNNVRALMDRGFVLQARKDWQGAKDSFDRVIATDPTSYHALRAREESAWSETQLGQSDEAIVHFEGVLHELEGEEGREFELARCLWRLGQTYWGLGGDKREQAYTHFIQALKKDPSYAPAFTSLGLYYLECASPSDPVRASKCFQKAFELDPREALAARHLAEGFANEREWDLVEVVVRRTIEGEGSAEAGPTVTAEAPSSDVTANSWAWKALGVVELTHQNYPAAIQAFQVALRAEPQDATLWLRLGEAYGKAGRYAAAIKALEHAHELNPDDWLSSYFIAEAQQGVGLYREAIQALEVLVETRPSELGIISSLASTYLDLGVSELEGGFISRAESSFLSSLRYALKFLSIQAGLRSLGWKIITDATFHLSTVSTFQDEQAVLSTLAELRSHLPSDNARLKDIISPPALESPIDGLDALKISILCADYRLSLSQSNNDTSAWYDMGMGLHAWSIRGNESDQLSTLITKCLSEAVQRESTSAAYWSALGTSYFSKNPRAAQHCFIKALEIDNKDAAIWCDLGLLYYFHDDIPLAQETFQRAQVLDPDCTLAWMGQALIASGSGEEKHAMALLAHTVGLDRPIPEADYTYSLRVFNSISERKLPRAKAVEHLLPVFFLLNRYCARQPDDATGLHLFALVCERLGHKDFARDLVNRGMRILERIYEEKEDPVVERQFMIANATLGRLLLSTNEPEDSMITYETVLGLLQDGDEVKGVLETQAKLGIAMGQATLRDMQEAVLSLQYAQGIAPENEALRAQCSILLAQALWSTRDPEYCELAKEELLKLISEDSNNLPAINVLAGLGILTKDEGLVDAAVSEIVSLPPDERVALDHDGNVDYLLIQYHLSQGDLAKAITTAQKSLFSSPANIVKNNTLGALLLKMRYPSGTLALVSGHENALTAGSTTLMLSAVAHYLLYSAAEPGAQEEHEKKALKAAQRAVMMNPGKAICWQVLACIRKAIEGRR
ncbi:superkiller protein 3 SKI3 [Ephemerocybe angulata]|uniref:Superkiller protein 3 SKI3 n=1 Tax=Ephemerocybe angulata TaxID=980116 RepID=A0A8H6MDG6_9AGAR|nr:superkiller protein 3 SKI3 [Tulosesus angulatus]